MKITIEQAVDVAKAMMEADKPQKIIVGKSIGYNPSDEISSGGIVGTITSRGGKILSTDMCIAQIQGEMYRVAYSLPDGAERVAYINSGRVDIDVFVEESLIFALADDPKEGVVELFEEARAVNKKSNAETLRKLEELDQLVPRSFRRLIFSSTARKVAHNIYRANGELSQSVFEPWKGTLAYPKNDQEAKRFFEKQPEWLQHKDTMDAYMLVGQMVEDGLI